MGETQDRQQKQGPRSEGSFDDTLSQDRPSGAGLTGLLPGSGVALGHSARYPPFTTLPWGDTPTSPLPVAQQLPSTQPWSPDNLA